MQQLKRDFKVSKCLVFRAFYIYLKFLLTHAIWLQCFISEYTYHVGHVCKGANIAQLTQAYTTLQAAKAACLDNVECGCMWEYRCDGDGGWYLRKGSGVAPHVGTCAWNLPGKLTCPFDTRKLIYFT